MGFRMLSLSLFLVTGLMAQTALKVGDKAPDFSLPATTGGEIKLSDFQGKKSVVVGFFPAAFTGGCTKEVTGYVAGADQFDEAGAQILLISTDNLPTLSHWAGEVGAPYPMLSDFMRNVAREYGVLNEERGIANRTTFIVDTNGTIQHIVEGGDAVDWNLALEACNRLGM